LSSSPSYEKLNLDSVHVQQSKWTHRVRSRFRDTFGEYLLVAFLMTSIATILALVPGGIEKEFVAICAENDLVKLLRNELVAIQLVNLFALANGNLTCETGVHRTLSYILLD
jgi:hypothetical protein